MDTERYKQVRELLDGAFSLAPHERAAFLDRTCRDDAELRREVESLLAHADDEVSIADVVRNAAEHAQASAGSDEAEGETSGARRATSEPSADAVDATVPAVSRPTDSPRAPGERIGRYRLLRQLGEGGMGQVWLAEQTEPIHRQVALKVIKHGMDIAQVIARFEAERQALALMDHPAVARVFDAGATPEGRPYFVMEYVEGVPITAHCDQHRLTTRERLALFVQVCAGVQHAHQKAIIHRDLKPSNVLVSIQDGCAAPKIIDFGLAKATAQKLTAQTVHTEFGVLMGTPAYMSPEQAELTGEDIDTRTDVYALGVILYELLVGALPFDPQELRKAGFDGIRRMIREEEPARPSTRVSKLGERSTETTSHRRTDLATLQKSLRGDLDWITMKALEKDRTRRYGSPAEMAADIGRHLRDEPVLATPPSRIYQARKFVRRHRVGVGVATAALLVLVAFAVTMTVQADRIAKQRNRAERVAQFLTNMFSDLNPQRLGEALTTDLRDRVATAERNRGGSDEQVDTALESFEASMRGVNGTDAALHLIDQEILARAATTIEADFGEDLQIAGRLEHTIGMSYLNLGLYEEAAPHLRQGHEMHYEEFGAEHARTLQSEFMLAFLALREARYDDAAALFRKNLEIKRRVLGGDHALTLRSTKMLGVALAWGGRTAEAEPFYVAAFEGARRTQGEEHLSTLNARMNLGLLYMYQGRYAEAESLLSRVLRTEQRVLGEEGWETLASKLNLAITYSMHNRYAEAESLLIEVIADHRRVRGDEYPATLFAIHGLAALLGDLGRYAEAEPLILDALAARRRMLGDEHEHTVESIVILADLHLNQGRYAEAEPLYVEALETQRRVLGDEHPETILVMHSLASLYQSTGRPVAARALFEEEVAGAKRIIGGPEATLYRKGHFAWVLLTCEPAELRDPELALKLSLEVNEATGHEIFQHLDTLALAYHFTGQTSRAIEVQRQAVALTPPEYFARTAFEARLAEFEAAAEGGREVVSITTWPSTKTR